jgi:glycosyltransferase involved in cell wall biosynthesis
MRIGIDARMAGTGIGRYTSSLVRELAAIDRDSAYTIFLRAAHAERFEAPGTNFRAVVADSGAYSLSEQFRLPGLVRRQRLDLMHYPHFNVPLLAPTPYVVTVHDLTHSLHRTGRASRRRSLSYAPRRRAYDLTVARAVRRATHVITVSESTKRAVRELLGTPGWKLSVTYEGVDPVDFAHCDPDALERLKVERPYFLYVGSAHPHKNLQLLLRAFAGLVHGGGTGLQLVLAGDHGPFRAELEHSARALNLGSALVLTGEVTEPELAALYGGAHGFVFISLSEGFGLPGLEAMAHGVPVLAASATSLPEIYGDAALYVEPTDLASVEAGLRRLAEDDALRAELRAHGERRVGRYSWTEMAQATLQIYRDAIASSRAA